MADCDIGVMGLAVMGQNLIMNMNDRGFKVCAFNRTTSKVDEFLQDAAKGSKVVGAHSLQEFISKLKRPRRVMLMIQAGKAIDVVIEELLPYLEKGDIIIDGGNSHFPDTERRCNYLKEKGLYFLGTGVSGGEEGARRGPSMMPGGHIEAWPYVKPIFQAIAAHVDKAPCCDWVGNNGAGHYVKMVHNGIEYGDIQLICEAYHLLSNVLGCSQEELKSIFADWNKGELDSYLIEIASHIFNFPDTDGKPILDKILDVAGQKGTGKWTAANALDEGIPLTLIAEAVFARYLSSLKEERETMSKIYKTPKINFQGDRKEMIEAIRQGLYASKILSYAQGFMLMRQASNAYSWDLNFGAIALMWRGGCIIRSRFLGKIKEAFDKNPHLENLLCDDFFKDALNHSLAGWRKTVSLAVEHGVAMPCFMAGLTFFDGLKTQRSSANLTQALRDYFGAHTY
ncbi:MAG: decarboxylating NADP(+)-dependent phosphogluconate dehydrogenase, partial [Chlamydiae bacterium]|nr:decarboxylating NADP(+)-dependent phosphogluconate dehydrogenase [Chlamydiota bacterium]